MNNKEKIIKSVIALCIIPPALILVSGLKIFNTFNKEIKKDINEKDET